MVLRIEAELDMGPGLELDLNQGWSRGKGRDCGWHLGRG